MTSKGKGIIITTIYHICLAILLFMTGFTSPVPPLAEKGILINFGNSDDGSGDTEPAPSQAPPKHVAKPTPQTQESPLTQDYEEAPSLPTPPKKKKETPKPPKPVEKPQEPVKQQVEDNTATEQSETKPDPKPQPTVNKKAMFPGQKTDGSGSGEGETGKPGNQGSPEGSVDSQNRIGSTGGGGDADRGIVINLKGRSTLSLPKPQYPKEKSGDVVVRVKVDRDGNVVEAVGGQKGSTTQEPELVRAAEKAAINAKFNVSANAPAFQIGTITYKFRLQ